MTGGKSDFGGGGAPASSSALTSSNRADVPVAHWPRAPGQAKPAKLSACAH